MMQASTNISNIFQTNWLASKAVFYNTITGEVSYKMLDVIDWNNFDWNLEGLKNYLQFGYCVCNATPIKNVFILRYSSVLTQKIFPKGKKTVEISFLPDPALTKIDKKSTVDDVIQAISAHINNFEQNRNLAKRLLLPLSGGYDSRFLASLIKDKSSIDAFTYPLVKTGDCIELARAKEVAKRLNLNHHTIKLENFNNNEWCLKAFNEYGLQMSLHAMYHMEFYENIKKNFGNRYIVVSGSVGDWYSGEKLKLKIPQSPSEFQNLFFNHGISIPQNFIKLNNKDNILEEYFENNIADIKSNRIFLRLAMMRNRINLAGFITSSAELYYDTYTPYYDIDVAFSQLNIPCSLSDNRQWQADYFKSINLDVENDQHIKFKPLNRFDPIVFQKSFDIQTMLLDINQLKYFVAEERLDWINKQLIWLKNTSLLNLEDLIYTLIPTKLFNEILHRIGNKIINVKKINDAVKAFNEWTVLKPLEYINNLRIIKTS